MNLTELLDHTANRWPDKVAFIEENITVSYGALVAQIATWTEKLQRLGLPPGSRVGLQYPNSVQYVALTFALWRVQAVVVPLPTECTAEEIAEITEAMELAGRLGPAPAEAAVPLGPDCFFTKFHPPQPPDNHGLNLAFIRFTSGTTSARKGVALAHETIRDRVASANQAFGIGPDDTVIWCLPMAHHFLITIVLYLKRGRDGGAGAACSGETVSRSDQSLEGNGALRRAVSFRDAGAGQFGSADSLRAPSCFHDMRAAAKMLRRISFKSLRSFARRRLLGVIELGLVSLNTDDPRGRWNSVGHPAGDFRVRIYNPDADGCGEVAVAGPGIFDAYVAPWVPRDQVLRDGWFFTGDIGRIGR